MIGSGECSMFLNVPKGKKSKAYYVIIFLGNISYLSVYQISYREEV